MMCKFINSGYDCDDLLVAIEKALQIEKALLVLLSS